MSNTTFLPRNFIGDYAVIKFEDGPIDNRRKYYGLIDRKGNILHSAAVIGILDTMID